MGRFDGIENAKVMERTPFPADNFEGKVQVLDTRTFSSPARGETYFVKFRILETNNEKDPVGSERAWFLKWRFPEQSLAAVAEFLQSCLGYSESVDGPTGRIDREFKPILKQLANESGDPVKQPVKGLVAHLRCKNNAKGNHTRYNWRNVATTPVMGPPV